MPTADPQETHEGASPAALTSAPLSPFRHPVFTVIWIATVVANIGSWMYSAAAGWLMTSLDSDPLIVALVQVATNLPLLIFALPAGALADIIELRRLLLVGELFIVIVSFMFALMVWRGHVTPFTLLLFMFLDSAGNALTAPAWQSIIPKLVPKRELGSAIALNSVGVNISRAIGPALGGIVISVWGIATPFWVNAFSNLGVIGSLFWWRPHQQSASRLPAERFVSAMRLGIRYARNSPPLHATLMRAVGFFLFASTYWALLPLVARNQIAGGPQIYGVLLGAIGTGAVGGAFVLPQLKAKMSADWIVAAGTIGTALSMVLFGFARDPLSAVAASLIAGVCWIGVFATLSVSAQLALPDWVRGRGIALFVTTVFGAMTLGSLIAGQLAATLGLPIAHFIAAAGAVFALPFVWRWKLHSGAGLDLTPSMSWPAPTVAADIDNEQGPVLVTIEYRLAAGSDRTAFLDALERMGRERRRDGAYAWGTFEDTAVAGRFLETFLVESWLEHLRQHDRVTNADALLQNHLLHHIQGEPIVTHLITAEPNSEGPAN